MAGAPGAFGSLFRLSSSGETGWNPIPARAAGATNRQRASAAAIQLTRRKVFVNTVRGRVYSAVIVSFSLG